MRTKDPMMEEPAFTNNLIVYGKKLLVVLTVLIVTGATLLLLMYIFNPPEYFGYGYLFITNGQFMMLYTMDIRTAGLTVWRLFIVNAILAVVTTLVMFGFGMLFAGG